MESFITQAEQAQSVDVRLAEAITKWQDYYGNLQKKPSVVVMREALDELDALWEEAGLMDAVCAVSGRGFWDRTDELSQQKSEDEGDDDECGDTIVESESDEPAYGMGEVSKQEVVSKGFMIGDLSMTGRYRLWAQFLMSSEAFAAHSTRVHHTDSFVLLEPETMNVVSSQQFERPFIRPEAYDTSVSERTLLRCSSDLVRLLSDTKFRRSSRLDQGRIIDRLLHRADHETMVRGRPVMFQAETLYVPNRDDDKTVYQKFQTAGMLLAGECLGVGMRDRELLRTKAIRRDADLPDKHEGLSLIVELNHDNQLPEKLGLNVGDIAYIPMLSGDVAFDFE